MYFMKKLSSSRALIVIHIPNDPVIRRGVREPANYRANLKVFFSHFFFNDFFGAIFRN